jgi:hypothetical protein
MHAYKIFDDRFHPVQIIDADYYMHEDCHFNFYVVVFEGEKRTDIIVATIDSAWNILRVPDDN